MKAIVESLFAFYKRFISPLFGNSCRYYPSCSDYAKMQLIYSDGKVGAFLSSVLRILRCNQLFNGGIDYPVVTKKICHPVFGNRDITHWFIPTGKKNRYFLIKNLSN